MEEQNLQPHNAMLGTENLTGQVRRKRKTFLVAIIIYGLGFL
jgi:hypothetical protein